MNFKKFFLVAGLAATTMFAAAQSRFEVKLYNSRQPYNNGDNMDTAKVRVYLPIDREATGRAVIICPGGGYSSLSMDTEGYDWGEFFQNQGIAAIVLKYRLPHGNPEVPIADAEQAIKLTRMNATSWKINRDNVGIMGFSAGGHLAVASATYASTNYLSPLGIVPKVSVRPDFVAALYPVVTLTDKRYVHRRSRKGILGEWGKCNKKLKDSLSLERHVPANCPPVFIVHCDDDPIVSPGNSRLLDSALTSRRIPHQYIRYNTGGHGFGASEVKGSAQSRRWREAFVSWLNNSALPLVRDTADRQNKKIEKL